MLDEFLDLLFNSLGPSSAEDTLPVRVVKLFGFLIFLISLCLLAWVFPASTEDSISRLLGLLISAAVGYLFYFSVLRIRKRVMELKNKS